MYIVQLKFQYTWVMFVVTSIENNRSSIDEVNNYCTFMELWLEHCFYSLNTHHWSRISLHPKVRVNLFKIHNDLNGVHVYTCMQQRRRWPLQHSIQLLHRHHRSGRFLFMFKHLVIYDHYLNIIINFCHMPTMKISLSTVCIILVRVKPILMVELFMYLSL